MKLKNKVLTTSLAATLVLGSVAGLPLSSKGLAEVIGAGKAYATGLPSEIVGQLNPVYSKLTPDEIAVISTAKQNLGNLSDVTLVSDIASKITVLSDQEILDLIKGLSQVVYDQDYNALVNFVNNPTNRDLLAELKGETTVTDNIGYADAVAFTTAFQDALEASLEETSDLLALTSVDAAKAVITSALDDVISNQNLKISKVLSDLNITGADLTAAFTKLNNAADTPNNDALKALISAYIRSQSTVTAAAVAGEWRQLSPVLSVWGEVVPGVLVDYEISGNSDISYQDGKLVLSSAVTTTTSATVAVTATVLGKLIYQGDVSLTFTVPSSGGGGGAPSSDIPAPDIKNATEVLNNVSLKLTELLNEGKGNGLARAVEAIENAIRKAANIDLSKAVKVESGVAKPTLDAAKLDDVFKNVKEIAKLGKEKLAAAAPDAKPTKVIATLDLGTVDAKTAQIPLSKDLVAKAKENGVDAMAIMVNGISLAIDVDQIGKDTNVTINKEEKTAAASVTKLAVASEVYEFTFESNGEKIESFTKPVEVRIPLPSTSGVDSDLLVLTKLDNGKLVFKGGKYNAETKEFVALNKSFSTYAVIENKVTFNDIASVNDWAGRQIAVTAAKGIVEGRSEGQFVPGDKVTRAEFAKLIVKAFGLEDATATESFGDVNDSDWFKPYVAAAVKAGLIQGRSDDKFEPNATITRAELATIASRALTKVRDYKGAANADAVLKAFADASDIHSSLKDGVALSADLGVVIGEDGGKFNPNNGSTRAQAAVVIYRLLNK